MIFFTVLVYFRIRLAYMGSHTFTHWLLGNLFLVHRRIVWRWAFLWAALLLLCPGNTMAQSAQRPDDAVAYLLNKMFRLGYTGIDQQLDSLRQVAKRQDDDRLRQYIRLIELIPQRLAAKTTARKADLQRQLDSLAEQTPYADVKGFYYFNQGLTAFYAGQYPQSLPLLFRARKFLEEAQYETYPFAPFYYKGFFDLYYYFEDYRTAAYYCRLSLKHPSTGLYVHYGIYNNLGLCYLKLKQYANARQAFNAGIAGCRRIGNASFEALIVGNLGNTLRLEGQYQQALPLLYRDVVTNEKAIPENAVISRFYVANALLHLDSIDKARRFLRPPAFQMPLWTFPGFDLIRLETTALYYTKTGQYALASHYKDSLLVLKDSLKARFDYKKIMVQENHLRSERYFDERRLMETRASRERLIRNSILGGLLLAFLAIAGWLDQRRRYALRLQARQQQLANERLTHAQAQLTDYVRHVNEQNDLIGRIRQQLLAATPNPTEPEHQTQTYLAQLQQSILLTDDQWQTFKERFERVFPAFFDDLMTQHPDLTPAEYRLVALLKLQLPNPAMANMLGISTESLKKTRYRLRKKYPALLRPE